MRILLGLILTISFSAACERFHEDVGEYKMGCPFEDKANYEYLSSEKGMDIYVKNKHELFDAVLVTTINNNIVRVEYAAEEADLSESDVNNLMRELKEKWGEPKAVGDEYQIFWEPNNGIVSRVFTDGALNDPEYGGSDNLYLIYETHEYDGYDRKRKVSP